MISVKDLQQLANETRGVMNKGRTLIGKEVLDFDISLSWTRKLAKIISEKYLIPKSIKRICIYKIDEGKYLL